METRDRAKTRHTIVETEPRPRHEKQCLETVKYNDLVFWPTRYSLTDTVTKHEYHMADDPTSLYDRDLPPRIFVSVCLTCLEKHTTRKSQIPLR